MRVGSDGHLVISDDHDGAGAGPAHGPLGDLDQPPPGPGAADLSAEEEAATRRFLENVNKWREARQMEEVSHGHRREHVNTALQASFL